VKRQVRLVLVVPSLTGVVVCSALSLNCLSDPRASESVQVISTCDLDALDATPSSPEATVKVFVQAAQALAQASTAQSNTLLQLCNDIDKDLGLVGGTDLQSACEPIVKREEAIENVSGPNSSGWFGFTYPPTCQTDPTAEASCIAKCAGECDLSKCSLPVQGTCPGDCTGTCSTSANAGTCNGSCQGTCNNDTLNACPGECIGTCASAYLGACTTGCDNSFLGHCGGTCTGLCDQVLINDGGAFVCTDGGCPDGAQAGPPPSNADGNCTGVCAGVCSSNASGSCASPCSGTFSGGVCQGPCTGECISGQGAGCAVSPGGAGAKPTTCDGVCTSPTGDAGAHCAGLCQGTCSQPVKDARCTGALKCGQNVLCADACSAQSTVTTTCGQPDAVEVEAISDPQLYAELKHFGPQLAAVAQTVALLRTAAGYVTQQTVADFQQIGASGDLVRACVASASTATEQAQSTLETLSQQDITVLH
jgi:hypothetical protein